MVSERKERIAQRQAEIDGLLDGVTPLRQMLESTQGLLKARHRLAVGRARHAPSPRLPAVGQGFVPYLALQGMVGQPLDLLERAARRRASRGPRRSGRAAPAAAPGRRLP